MKIAIYRKILTLAIILLMFSALLVMTEVLIQTDYASRKLIELVFIVLANICSLLLAYSVGLETKLRKYLFIVAMFMSISGVFEYLYFGMHTKYLIITTAVALNIFNGYGFNRFLKICFLGIFGITSDEYENKFKAKEIN